MALEKILVGDDRIEFAKENFPYIPDSAVDFVDNSEEFVKKAKTGDYNVLVTDLDYSVKGGEGFRVLEELRGINSRKILWTGRGSDAEVQRRGKELGAEVLDKDELGSLVGQVVSKAPLKQDGDVLVYVPKGNTSVYLAIKKVLDTLVGDSRLVVSDNLKPEIESGRYGLVIDTSTFSGKRKNGVVAHDLKYLKLKEVPRVVCVTEICSAVADIVRYAGSYLHKPDTKSENHTKDSTKY